MSLYDDLRSQLRLILVQSIQSEYPQTLIINSHESGNEPTGTYGVVNILSFAKTGLSSSSTLASTDDNIAYNLQVSIPYQSLVQYTFVGKDSGDHALYASMRLGSSPLSREYANGLNLGIMEVSEPRRLPQKRDTQWIDQWSFDVRYSMILSYKQAVDIITRIDYQDPFTDQLVSVPPQ